MTWAALLNYPLDVANELLAEFKPSEQTLLGVSPQAVPGPRQGHGQPPLLLEEAKKSAHMPVVNSHRQ